MVYGETLSRQAASSLLPSAITMPAGVTLYAADADWRLVMTNGMHISYLPKGPSKDVGPARSLVEIADDILEHLTGMGGTLVSSFAVPKVS